MGKKIILASSSPRRRDLLIQIGLDFDILPSHRPEEMDPALPPDEMAQKLAQEKALDTASRLTEGLVVGADTIVVLQGKIMGKPSDSEEAFRTLKKLSGRFHEVITALALLDVKSRKMLTGYEKTRVFFRRISDEEIQAYINSGEPMDKAGAYGIQGKGILFVQKINGCYTNVVGLPLVKLAEMFSRMGTTLI